MAKLAKEKYPGNWKFDFNTDDVRAELTRTEELLESVPSDRHISFPVADGQAHYFVKSWSPLVLQHIPYGDAWEISQAHLRGLTRKEVETMIEVSTLISNI